MAKDDWTQNGVIPASGHLDLVFTPFAGQDWVIESVSCDGSIVDASGNQLTSVGGLAVGTLYRDSQFISFFIASKDTVEGVPIPLANGRKFRVRWTGATVGAPVQATIWYDNGKV